jgi:hypothetical protein
MIARVLKFGGLLYNPGIVAKMTTCKNEDLINNSAFSWPDGNNGWQIELPSIQTT